MNMDDIETAIFETNFETDIDLDSLSTGFVEVGSSEASIENLIEDALKVSSDELNELPENAQFENAQLESDQFENPKQTMTAAVGSQGAQKEEDLVIDLSEIARMVPNKMAFKIGEVAEITGLKTYVLRYWESEFEALNPQKSAFNQRMYSRRDVETVLLIKKLLYEEKFSIAGAKKKLKELRRELKNEKQIVEVQNRFEDAVERVAELVEEIALLKRLFL